MRYGLFTFKPHASDTKQLMEQMLALLQPQIKKMENNRKEYVLGIDNPGKPNEHIHMIFPITGDTTQKVEQFILNTGIKKLIENLKSTNTEAKHAFNYKLVKNTEEDKMRTIGYCAKDSIKYSNIYSQEYIAKCINLHWVYKKLDNKKKITGNGSIKTLKPNEVLTYMEDFVERNHLDYNDPHIIRKMKEERLSFVNVSRPQREIIREEFILMNKDKVHPHTYNFTKNICDKDVENEVQFWKHEFTDFIRRLMEKSEAERGFLIETAYLTHFDANGNSI